MTSNTRREQVKNTEQYASSPETAGASDVLARIREYHGQGRLEEAEKLCNTIIMELPSNALAHVLLGDILQSQGRVDHAIRAYRRAIRMDRRESGTHLKLAMALEATGKLSEAIACYATCLVLAPNDLHALTSLAGAYLKAGKLQECASRLHKIFAQTPNAPNAHVLAGELTFARGLFAEAAKHFQHALSVNPYLPQVQAKLGHSLKHCGAHAQAIEAFHAALRQNPNDVESLIELASLQAEMGDLKLAEFNLRRAIELKNDDAMLRVSLASALVIQGRLDEALYEYRSARAMEPGFSPAIEGEADCLYRSKSYDKCYELLKGLADSNKMTAGGARTFSRVCRKMKDGDSAIVVLENICRKPTAPAKEKAVAHYALGDAYDAIRNYDAAFNNYMQANKLLIGNIYVPSVAESITTNLIQAFPPDRWPSLPHAARGEIDPIFIMGMPRSGTSLTEQIVASHPNVCGAGELTFVSEIFTPIRLDASFPNNIASLNTEKINRLANQYYSQVRALIGDARVMTDKMPGNIFCLGLMALMFPKATFVHCTRHPLDTCLSIYFQHFSGGYPWATSLESIGHYYRQYRRIVQHWSDMLGIPMLEVRYETLVSEQEMQSRRLIEYCGLGWDERCLSPHGNLRHVPTASYDQVTQPIYTTSIGRWKNYRKYLGPLIEVLGEYAEAE